MGLCLGRESSESDHRPIKLEDGEEIPLDNLQADNLINLQTEDNDAADSIEDLDDIPDDTQYKEMDNPDTPNDHDKHHKIDILRLKNSAKTIEVMRKNSMTISGSVVELKMSPKLRKLSRSEKSPSSESITDPIKANQPNYSPKLLKRVIPPHLKQDFQRNKSNSTSTMFINTTIKAPDSDEILKCMSVALHWNIQKNQTKESTLSSDIFDERIHPLEEIDNPFEEIEPPTEAVIYKYLSTIFTSESLSAECGVMCMAYIDRLLIFTGLSFNAYTWRRIVLGCIILASKVWEDQAVWNVDFINVFPNLTLQDLGRLERSVLDGLKFNVTLKSSVYTKYYFELRRLSERDEKNFPLEPLDKEGSKRLEERSKGLEETAKRKQVKRSKSVDNWTKSSVPVSIP